MSKEAIEAIVIEAIVTAYFAHMATLNPEGWLDFFAEDAISHDPVGGNPPVKVHETFQAFFQQMQGIFEQLEATLEHIFVAENEAVVKWTMRGESKSGKPVTFEGITFFQINDAGKMQTTRTYWNPAAIKEQLPS